MFWGKKKKLFYSKEIKKFLFKKLFYSFCRLVLAVCVFESLGLCLLLLHRERFLRLNAGQGLQRRLLSILSALSALKAGLHYSPWQNTEVWCLLPLCAVTREHRLVWQGP